MGRIFNLKAEESILSEQGFSLRIKPSKIHEAREELGTISLTDPLPDDTLSKLFYE